jgi:hypothetical protein
MQLIRADKEVSQAMPDEETSISLREYLERILVEREKAFIQYMDNHKEALEHLRVESHTGIQAILDKISALESRINKAEGSTIGRKDVWGYILAIVGFGLAAGIAIFNRFGFPH